MNSNSSSEPKLTRRQIDRQHRERDFLEAAERLFAAQGYHHTSIEDIAREANYATGTIYRYFPTKETLYAVLMERKSRQFLDFLKLRIASARTPLDKLTTLIDSKVEFFRQNKEFLSIYSAAGANLRWTFRDRFHEQLKGMHQEFQQFLRSVLVDCMQPGGLRRMDVTRLAQAYAGMTNHLLLDALNDERPESLEEARQFLLDLFQLGFMAPDRAGNVKLLARKRS